MKYSYSEEYANYKIGVVVELSNENWSGIGHVVGFWRNILNEVLISVKWCDGTTTDVHPVHLTLLGQRCVK